jgi:hypothetical protein
VLSRRAMKRLFALLLLGACGHTVTYTPLNDPPRRLSPRAPATVEIFLASRPPRPGVEIGLIEIEEDMPHSGGTPTMVGKLRSRAAQIGCDALIVSEQSERVQSYSTMHQGQLQSGTGGSATTMGTGHLHANYVRGHRATCFVYTDGPTSFAVEGGGGLPL